MRTPLHSRRCVCPERIDNPAVKDRLITAAKGTAPAADGRVVSASWAVSLPGAAARSCSRRGTRLHTFVATGLGIPFRDRLNGPRPGLSARRAGAVQALASATSQEALRCLHTHPNSFCRYARFGNEILDRLALTQRPKEHDGQRLPISNFANCYCHGCPPPFSARKQACVAQVLAR